MRELAAFAAAGVTLIALSAVAFAQEDLDRGKSGAQIFATDCAICHKTPQAAVKGGAPGEGFLRQHYTSSQQSAAAVAAYLRTIRAPAAKSKGASKAAAKPKGNKDTKPAEQKPAVEAKPSEPKAPEKKEQPAEKKQ